MKPKLTIIDKYEDLVGLKAYIYDKEFIAFDTETNGVTKDSIVIGYSICAAEDRAFYVILYRWDKEKNQLIANEDLIEETIPVMHCLKDKKLIMHNGVFDCAMVERNFKVSLIESLHTDTMILAHLLNENRRVGLKELAKEYFGEDSTQEAKEMKESVLANGGKLTKTQYEMFKADSYLMGKYGAKDALLTYKLFYELVPELYEQGLEDFFYKDESMPLLRGPTYQLNTAGLKVDVQALQTLKKTLEVECLQAKDFIYSEIKNLVSEKYTGTNKKTTFSISSPQQLSWLVFGNLGLEFGALTDIGKEVCKALGLKLPYTPAAKRDFIAMCEGHKDMVYSPEGWINGKKIRAKRIKDPWCYIKCDKKTLTKVSHRYKWIEKLLEYQRKTKILNTYVKGIESRMQYGVIYPSFLQHGTTSGRYSSREPNFQNLPRDDKRVKACISVRPGKVFVGADYSQLEPRVFAYLSRDKRLLQAFDGQSDFYSVIGMEVYGKYDCTPQKEGSPEAFGVKYKKLRDLSKVIALASTYGATAHQLAPTTGKSINETQEDIDNYFERFPDVATFMTDSHEIAKKHGEVTNIFGRPRRMPEAMKFNKIYGNVTHAELPYEARNTLNLAVNHRVQSTGASIVNRSAIRFLQMCNENDIKCNIVVQVHDSLVVECNEEDSEDVSLLLREAMENTVYLETIQLEAIPKIGLTLAEV